MRLFLTVASIIVILAIGCSVTDEISTLLPPNDSDNSTAVPTPESTSTSTPGPTAQSDTATADPSAITVGGFESRRLTTDPGADQDPAWDPRGTTIAFMTSKPGALDRPYDIGGINQNGAELTTMAVGPNSGIGIAGELAWVGDTGRLMTNKRMSIHSYMTFDTSKAPFNRTVSSGDDAAFTKSLVIPGGQGGDGLAVSRDGSTVMWMIRTSHDPSSYVVTVRIADVASLTGQSANDAGRALITHSAVTDGPEFNRGFALSADGSEFVVSLKSGNGFDLYLMDSATGEELQQLTSSGVSAGEHNLYPDISPDGTWVAFSSQTGPDARPDIYVVKTDGTGVAKVTDTPDISEMRPSWAPEGMDIAYQGQDFSEANPNWDIYRVPVFGGTPARLP